MLLPDPPVRGSDVPPRQEQDVQARVHQEHAQRGPGDGGLQRRPPRRDVRQRLPARPRVRRRTQIEKATASIRTRLSGNVSVKNSRLRFIHT